MDKKPTKAKEKPSSKQRAPWCFMYQSELQDMMYIFGDARHNYPETSELIESIVRRHVIELLQRAGALAMKRGRGARVTPEDVIFQIRHDPKKLHRLREYLNSKEDWRSTSVATPAAVPTHTTTAQPASGTAVGIHSLPKGVPPVSVAQAQEKPAEPEEKGKKKKLRFSWDVFQSLSNVGDDSDADDEFNDWFNSDDESTAALQGAISRYSLFSEEFTHGMTSEQLFEYNECRQASFTNNKLKKFREWIDAPSLGDDIAEILGYLAWEAVGSIVLHSLEVRRSMERSTERRMEAAIGLPRKRKRSSSSTTVSLLFSPSTCALPRKASKTPLLPFHVREAARLRKPLSHPVVDATVTQGTYIL